MSLLDLAYIVVPPALALVIAGVIVVQGNRRTALLDAEIAAYRVRKAEKRKTAAMVAEAAPQPVVTETAPAKTTSAERVESPVAPAVDAAAIARFYETTGLAKRPVSTEPDIIFTADGRTYVVQAKARSGSSTLAAAMRQAVLSGRTRAKRRTMKPYSPAVVVHDPARIFTPR